MAESWEEFVAVVLYGFFPFFALVFNVILAIRYLKDKGHFSVADRGTLAVLHGAVFLTLGRTMYLITSLSRVYSISEGEKQVIK